VAALGLDLLDLSVEAVLDRVEDGEVHDFQLADADLLAGHVEVLVVAEDQLFHAGALDGGLDLEHLHAQGHDVRHAGDLGQGLDSLLVGVGAGHGLEHNRVGQDGAEHGASDALGNLDVVERVHGLDDRAGAAHGPDPHLKGVRGGDVAQLVVVDDHQNLGLAQVVGALGQVGVVHQRDLFARVGSLDLGGFEAELLDDELGLGGQLALSARLSLLADLVAQVGQRDGGNNAVGVGVLVTKNLNHCESS